MVLSPCNERVTRRTYNTPSSVHYKIDHNRRNRNSVAFNVPYTVSINV